MDILDPMAVESVDKIDLYSTLHKGLRRALYNASQAIAVANPADESMVSAALDRLYDTLKLVSKLGSAESARVHVFLDVFRPDATQAARADSERQTQTVDTLVRLMAEVRAANAFDRRSLLASLDSTFAGFVGEVLLHMADAELEVMPLLRETGTYDDLALLQRQIFADLGRDAFVALVREIMPAVGKRERVEFLQTVQRAAPSVVWPSIWWAVCSLSSAEEQEGFAQVLGVDCTQMPIGYTF